MYDWKDKDVKTLVKRTLEELKSELLKTGFLDDSDNIEREIDAEIHLQFVEFLKDDDVALSEYYDDDFIGVVDDVRELVKEELKKVCHIVSRVDKHSNCDLFYYPKCLHFDSVEELAKFFNFEL